MAVKICVRSTFPEKNSRFEIKSDDTVESAKKEAAKALGLDLTGYGFASAAVGEDVVLWSSKRDNEKHGLHNDSTLFAIATASMIPKREKTVVAENKDLDSKFASFTDDNVWRKLGSKKDVKLAMEYIDTRAIYLFEHKTWLRLPQSLLLNIISRSSLVVEGEIQVFEACRRWAEAQIKKSGKEVKADTLTETMGPLLPQIRFLCMTTEDIAAKVIPTGILAPTQILDLFTYLGQKDVVPDTKPGKSLQGWKSAPRDSATENYWNPDDCPDKRLEIKENNLLLSSPDNYIDRNVGVRAKHGYSKGIHYWELRVQLYNGGGNGFNTAGVCTKECPLVDSSGYPLANSSGQAWVLEMIRLDIISGSSHSTRSYSSSGAKQLKTGDVVGFLLDMDKGELSIYYNNVFHGIPFTGLKGTLYPCVAMGRLHRNTYQTDFKAKSPK